MMHQKLSWITDINNNYYEFHLDYSIEEEAGKIVRTLRRTLPQGLQGSLFESFSYRIDPFDGKNKSKSEKRQDSSPVMIMIKYLSKLIPQLSSSQVLKSGDTLPKFISPSEWLESNRQDGHQSGRKKVYLETGANEMGCAKYILTKRVDGKRVDTKSDDGKDDDDNVRMITTKLFTFLSTELCDRSINDLHLFFHVCSYKCHTHKCQHHFSSDYNSKGCDYSQASEYEEQELREGKEILLDEQHTSATVRMIKSLSTDFIFPFGYLVSNVVSVQYFLFANVKTLMISGKNYDGFDNTNSGRKIFLFLEPLIFKFGKNDVGNYKKGDAVWICI
jgi:hypothetical protein